MQGHYRNKAGRRASSSGALLPARAWRHRAGVGRVDTPREWEHCCQTEQRTLGVLPLSDSYQCSHWPDPTRGQREASPQGCTFRSLGHTASWRRVRVDLEVPTPDNGTPMPPVGKAEQALLSHPGWWLISYRESVQWKLEMAHPAFGKTIGLIWKHFYS